MLDQSSITYVGGGGGGGGGWEGGGREKKEEVEAGNEKLFTYEKSFEMLIRL